MGMALAMVCESLGSHLLSQRENKKSRTSRELAAIENKPAKENTK